MHRKHFRGGIFTQAYPTSAYGSQLTAFSDGALGQSIAEHRALAVRSVLRPDLRLRAMHGLGDDAAAYFAPPSQEPILDAATGQPVLAPVSAITGKPVVVGALAGTAGLLFGFAAGGLIGYLIGKARRG